MSSESKVKESDPKIIHGKSILKKSKREKVQSDKQISFDDYTKKKDDIIKDIFGESKRQKPLKNFFYPILSYILESDKIEYL